MVECMESNGSKYAYYKKNDHHFQERITLAHIKLYIMPKTIFLPRLQSNI